ncbi:EI24 domain-containing protein [Haloferula sp. BvORR071]|uniref:EI24 domain-containing protein n=1 Tax=Haloferula sp. BvORR071 TaxID=1396141 RepID=UPI000557C50B|nr:EI24 domain-containing protein [Haloferula sp. BvORR071]
MISPSLGVVHGFKSVPTAFGILLRRPQILLWMLPPLILTLILDAVAFYFAFGWMHAKIEEFLSGRGYAQWLTSAANIFGGVAVVLLLGWAFAWMFLALSGPFQDFISAAVERERHGGGPKPPVGFRGFARGILRGAIQSLVLIMITLPVLLVGFVPALGPLIVFAWSAFAMGFSFTTIPAGRLRERLALARRQRGAMFGLGSIIALAAIVPFLNVLLMPVFVVAGTLVYLESNDPQPASPPMLPDEA